MDVASLWIVGFLVCANSTRRIYGNKILFLTHKSYIKYMRVLEAGEAPTFSALPAKAFVREARGSARTGAQLPIKTLKFRNLQGGRESEVLLSLTSHSSMQGSRMTTCKSSLFLELVPSSGTLMN